MPKPWFTAQSFQSRPGWGRVNRVLLIVSAALLLTGWLLFTPEGAWEKLSAIAYAVCHRAPTHSYFAHDHQFPLCARCTGMYLGAILSLLIQLKRGRRALFPRTNILILLGAFLIFFAVDGINSMLGFGGNPPLYESNNILRLVSGVGLGWGMAAMLVPAFHQTVWKDPVAEPLLHKPTQILLLAGLSVLPVLAVIFDFAWLSYPVAVLTTLAVPLLLTFIYTLLILIVTFRENTISSWRQLAPFLLAGFLIALLQIYLFDYARLTLTGTWAGFPLL